MKCEICRINNAAHNHHKFSQTKLNRKLYPEYIDDKKNIQRCCHHCHIGEAEGLVNFDEMKFCQVMRIIPRSKIGREQYKRLFDL